MRKIFYALTILILGISGYFAFRPKKVSVEVVTVQKGLFTENLNSEGRIRSRVKHIVYAAATGNIDALNVEPGDSVTQGQAVSILHWDQNISVKSPITGVISKVFRDSSGPIQRGEPIFEVSSLSDLEVVAEVLTTDAIRLKVGGRAKILGWGGDGELMAQIAKISRAGAVKTSALGVEEERTEISLRFTAVPPEISTKLGDNYHVEVQFFVFQQEDVLTVPLGALFKSGDAWAVYVVKNSQTELREVQVGARSDREALISSGLNTGDQVILFPGENIRPNLKVVIQN